MKDLTPIEWLLAQIEEQEIDDMPIYFYIFCKDALEIEKEQRLDDLVRLQIFLSDKGLINDYDWDFEKLAKQFIKNNK
jgi:hypothetical protein